MDSMKIICINVNGIRTRENELKRYIQQQGQNCVIALSDTRLSKDTNINSIEGYTMLRNDKITKNPNVPMATAGGVALLVPCRWTCQRVMINYKGDNIEALAAIVLPQGENSQPIKVMSVYNHPENHFPLELITEFKNMKFNGNHLPGLIVGDFNCPHVAFGSRTTNGYGSKLLQNINNENLVFFNDGKSTYCSSSSGQSNVLDFVFGEPRTTPLIESCTVSGDIGSDHFPVVTSFKQKTMAKSFCKLNQSLWAAYIDKDMEKLLLTGRVDEDIENVSNIFQNAHSKSTFTPNLIIFIICQPHALPLFQ